MKTRIALAGVAAVMAVALAGCTASIVPEPAPELSEGSLVVLLDTELDDTADSGTILSNNGKGSVLLRMPTSDDAVYMAQRVDDFHGWLCAYPAADIALQADLPEGAEVVGVELEDTAGWERTSFNNDTSICVDEPERFASLTELSQPVMDEYAARHVHANALVIQVDTTAVDLEVL